ncbi:sarcolemmal membrane-associated protein-like [Uloborus diversus]|uniref:sarcolemmal membrane-associated protein-like n=1 Tax=Uloborus diversus TaxID=327109 RepID=UPI002409F53D|nr:sarcolemmal membrane-associated protein-like [Uloborus diversus]
MDLMFYLQDTKSSNGTFVNNQRLSKGSEESPAREVCSGDIVQFGVDVVENSRKVVHGCIVATLKLYLPDGKEAKASPTTTVVPLSPETSVSSQELYQLSQYLQEALHREQILENKLGTLQKVVANTQDESDIGWKALIEEDRLLSRIETLESQLQTCGKNVTEEKLKDDVVKLQEDKDKYQIAAKESLKKVLQEKLEAIRKVQDLENSLSNTENECTHLGEMNQKKEQEIQLLLEKSTESEKEIANLTTKLQELEEKYQDMLSQTAEDKLVLENNTEEMRKEEQILSAKIEALQAENDFAKEQLSAMKAHFDILKKDNDPDETIERNGNLSADDHIDSAEETERKLIQHLNREVNRLSSELERVRTENRKNEAHSYTDNEDFKTNGDAKPSDYINKLQADIQQLKKVLSETRDNKKVVDVELLQVRAQLDEVQTNAKKVSAELRNVQEQLSTARQQVKEKTEHVLELECKLLSLIKEKESESEKELGIEFMKDGSYPAKGTI